MIQITDINNELNQYLAYHQLITEINRSMNEEVIEYLNLFYDTPGNSELVHTIATWWELNRATDD